MGESYPTDRYSPVERYVPRYPAPPLNTGRYLDPYSRRDIYLPPPRYLRPLHRYTPRPTRIEYRAHVEYLGSSGGRYVKTPPMPRAEEPLSSRRQEPLSLCCSNNRRTPHHIPTHHPVTTTTTATIWRSVGPPPPSPSPSPPSQTNSSTPPSTMDSGVYSRSGPSSSETPSSCSSLPTGPVTRTQSEGTEQQHPPRPQFFKQQSTPVTPAERIRAVSRSDLIKEKLKTNTAIFFGVHERSEETEKKVWMRRRMRLATRCYGELKPECQPTTYSAPGTDTGMKDETDLRWDGAIEPSPLRQKPSVASMTFKGVAILAAALNKQRGDIGRQRQTSRSYSPSTLGGSTIPQSPIDDEVFFENGNVEDTRLTAAAPADFVDTTADLFRSIHPVGSSGERHGSWRRSMEGRREGSSQVGLSRIHGIDLDQAHDNSDRRQHGQGIFQRLFGRSLKRSVLTREPVKEQLEDLEDHRPYFTYWLSTVQILILVISLISYGFGPFGMDLSHQSGLVLVTSLSLQQVDYTEPANFWLGPRAADLIHLGAKFAPCMRRDAKIIKEIEKGRERERETACCIRNDDSGCVQLSKTDCSVSSRNHIAKGLSPGSTISTWKKWTKPPDSTSGGRISGSVCGLDPKYCEAPASVAPYEWPDDITKWPICRKTSSPVQRLRTKDKLAAEHMVCEVIGHPCCIGIHATCKITTKEYCDFVHGTFHDEASLCSQVSCLDDVCGMLPFLNSEVPDQFYRLLTSIFLHAGIIQLAISLMIQWFLMRDLEKLTGTARLMIIYIGSGVAGNLASAIFIPYRADVGPAGSQSGLLACLIVEILNIWPMLRHPYRALFKHLAIAGMLFVVGLLPWFDNFSSFFGFLFGFLLSYAILPFVSLGEYDRQKKIFMIWVCLITTVFLFLLLVLFFYVIPVYDCEFCGYFNCLPLTRDFCSAQNINFKRTDSPV
ncbi:inactive rhomboid protein 1 isoform X3 [Halyomorpha halys]|uniref:inactive rhomboid protein 1 isoform X3 n=1 Tax=Halyomorpha halys TaxID=286706 RepID=UPI0006D50A5A|nr:inactive rhomboid protein 1 isoform X3 [Halyomorpha halys]